MGNSEAQAAQIISEERKHPYVLLPVSTYRVNDKYQRWKGFCFGNGGRRQIIPFGNVGHSQIIIEAEEQDENHMQNTQQSPQNSIQNNRDSLAQTELIEHEIKFQKQEEFQNKCYPNKQTIIKLQTDNDRDTKNKRKSKYGITLQKQSFNKNSLIN